MVVTDEFLSQLFSSSDKDANATVTVDLEAQTITNNATGESQSFEINPYKKECLLKGLDDIDFLMSNMDKILQFEQQRPFAYK